MLYSDPTHQLLNRIACALERIAGMDEPKKPRWSDDDDTLIATKLRTVDDAATVAVELGRTKGAVLARAVKLGLIDASQVALAFQNGSPS